MPRICNSQKYLQQPSLQASHSEFVKHDICIKRLAPVYKEACTCAFISALPRLVYQIKDISVIIILCPISVLFYQDSEKPSSATTTFMLSRTLLIVTYAWALHAAKEAPRGGTLLRTWNNWKVSLLVAPVTKAQALMVTPRMWARWHHAFARHSCAWSSGFSGWSPCHSPSTWTAALPSAHAHGVAGWSWCWLSSGTADTGTSSACPCQTTQRSAA